MKALDEQANEQGLTMQPAADMRRQSQEEIDEAKAEAERNPARLTLDPDNMVASLLLFHELRENLIVD